MTNKHESAAALKRVLFDSPIAFHPALAKIAGSVTAGLFLSQLCYWTGKGKRDDGWFWKTQREMEEETTLTRYEQETARKHLIKRGLIEEKRAGIPGKLHYRVNVEAITNAIAALDDPETTVRADNNVEIPQCENAGKPQCIPETTTETTTYRPPSEKINADNAEAQRFADECFGPKPPPPPRVHKSRERIAADTFAASQRFHARHAGKQDHPAFEKALARYGNDAPHMRVFQEALEKNFSLEPDWSNVEQVNLWAKKLRELVVAARGDPAMAIAAGKHLQKGGIPIGGPKTLIATARGLAAERVTASTAPAAQARKVYR